MIAPIAIAVISVAVLACFLGGHYRRKALFVEVLRERGFREMKDPSSDIIDFAVTVQWPEGRGIKYLLCYAKDEPDVRTVVANVRCFVTAGIRPEQVQHTIVALTFADRELPRLSICPSGLESHFRRWTEGGREVQVGSSDFDDMFFVLAKEPQADASYVRSHFASALLQHPGVILETGGHALLLYQQGRILTADALTESLSLAGKLSANVAAPVPAG